MFPNFPADYPTESRNEAMTMALITERKQCLRIEKKFL